MAFVAAAVGLVVASCGSTVQFSEQELAERHGDGRERVPSELGGPGSAGRNPTMGPAQVGASGSRSHAPAPPGTAPPRTSRPTEGPGTSLPRSRHLGVSDREITFGFVYSAGAEVYARTIGGPDAHPGNTKRQIEAVVKAVNADGGIAGRRVRLLPFKFDFGGSIASQLQAACAYFTEDNKTFAVSGNIAGITAEIGDVLYSCLGSRGVAFIENMIAGDTTMFARYPDVAYAPSSMTADRVAATLIDALVAAGWFGSSPVIGVHSLDSPMWHRIVTKVVKPRLAAHGLTATEEFYYRAGTSGADGAADYAGATLRFSSSRVTHVINVGVHPFLFAQAAESNGFRPKWSVDTDLSPSNWVSGLPPAQMEGSLGIGWAPSRDLLSSDRGAPVNSAEKRCLAIMQAAGEDTTPALARQLQLSACTSVFFLQTALRQASEVSLMGLAEGTAALRTGYLDPATWRSRFQPGRRDGLGAYRLLAYNPDCRCYRYSSGLRSLP